jgi:hypothetical protein
MSRFTLAFACFFKLLFGGKLPARAADYLPEEALRKALPARAEPAKAKADEAAEKAEKKPDKKPEKKPAPKADAAEQHNEGALALLALLQREGRLVDFLNESLDDYEDADIGAAVRDIHRGSKKVLDDYLHIEAVMPGDEDDDVTVPKGFDPSEVRLVGEVNGEPPFKGALRHHGWRVTEVKLPRLSEGVDRRVLAPAEVEIG